MTRESHSATGSLLRDLGLGADGLVATYLAGTRFVYVIRCDAAGVVVFANDAVTAHLVAPGGSLVGRSIFDHLTEPDAAWLKARLEGRQASATPVNLNFCDADGAPFTLSSFLAADAHGVLLIGEPVHDDDQRLRHQLLELNAELSTLARSRQRLALAEQKARREAELANRTKDHALTVIAHELRQPLNAAVAALGVLKQDPAGAPRARAILERQIGQMNELVEDLLHASRVLQGTIELQREVADLRRIAQDALELSELAAHARHQTVTLVAPDEPVHASVDRGRLRQVLGNLITNAVKYTPEGGTIVVAVDGSDDAVVRVRVRDSGQGIEPAELEGIFGLFVRATRGGNGLGVGLAVARRLVEVHEGTITASSDGADRGSEFVVTLPRVSETGPS